MKKLYIIIVLMLMVTSSFAQIPKHLKERVDRLWTFSISLGGTVSGGPANDLETAMISSGFDDTAPCVIFCDNSGTSNPFSVTGLGAIGFPWSLKIDRAINNYLTGGIIMSNNPIGTTLGYKSPDNFLFIDYSVFTFAPNVTYDLGNIFHAGIGPAVHITRTWMDVAGQPKNLRSDSKIGIIIMSGITWPAKSRFFLNVDYQYRYIGKVNIGPYYSVNVNLIDRSKSKFPATSCGFNHSFLSFGIGLRV